MVNVDASLFDFERQLAHVGDTRGKIVAFAGGAPFRSAHVSELELDEDFHRRPLRPEDLSFINFKKPVGAETTHRLPFLAANRLLLSINELAIARFSNGCDEAEAQLSEFYCEHNQILAAQIRPFLEDFAFDFLGEPESKAGITELVAALTATVMEESRFWGQTFAGLRACDYVEEGVRFILIQNWALMSSKRIALARAEASGFFGLAPSRNWPMLAGAIPGDAATTALAERCGVPKREHSYWQFYLSTSMARCNLLHALARRPDRALALYGAAFDAEAHWLAFGCLVGQASKHLGINAAHRNIDVESAVEDLQRRFSEVLEAVETRFGASGLRKVANGLWASRKLGVASRGDLGAQLRWLSSVEQFRILAQDINTRINAECPDIDRETFVEPREMCSTTHVHDDHRLVSVESGGMVFWGNLGMELRLKPGEMVLVPEGRLHGSSIESEECVYHQPIIPEAWIQELMARSGIASAA